jgi:membrane fusion protein (multidrug efflux system)
LPEATFLEVQQTNLPVYTEYVGQTYGFSDVQVQARVEGLITAMHYKEGSPIQKGALSTSIDYLP